MFDQILVPVRQGAADQLLIEPAVGLAKLSQAQVTLLHVVEKIAGAETSDIHDFHERLVAAAREALELSAQAFSREGIPVETVVLLGEAASEIVRFAASHGVDLIVMGSHCVGAEAGGVGWSTTSYKVGLLCQCPVLLVKNLQPAPRTRRKRAVGAT